MKALPPKRLLWGLLGGCMAGVVALWALSGSGSDAAPAAVTLRTGGPAPASYGQVPAFTLTDETGRPFTAGSLRGRVWIADFIFTSCAGQCPQMTARMRTLQQRLPGSIRLVSISVDPERDTPEVLARYARENGAQPGRWHFLTGDRASIERLCLEGFRIGYSRDGSEAEPVTHSVRLVLVDGTGAIRGFYDSTDDAAVDQLAKDTAALTAGESGS